MVGWREKLVRVLLALTVFIAPLAFSLPSANAATAGSDSWAGAPTVCPGVSLTSSCSFIGSNYGTSTQSHGTWNEGWTKTAWFKFTPIDSGTVTIRATSSFDNTLHATTSSNSFITSNDDSYGLDAKIAFAVTANQTYYFALGAYSGAEGEATLSVSMSVPRPPTSVSASVSGTSGTATLTWVNDNDQADSITSYDIIPLVNGTAISTSGIGGLATYGSPPSKSSTITGLTNGQTYTFKVRANNGNGTGEYSVASNAVTVYGTPAAPGGLTLTPGNNEISASYNAVSGSALGGGTLLRYEYKVGSGSWVSNSTNLSFSLSGLTNGTSYSISVRVVTLLNSVEQLGNLSTSSATPRTTPSAPTINSLTIGNGTLAVTLTHGSNGGSALTSIKYATSTDGVNFSATPIDVGSAPTNFTISGLTNATTYYVRVLAVNAAGSSGWSNVLSATPGAPPSAPTLNNQYSKGDQLFIRFTGSANSYGFPVTAYQYSTDNGATWANLAGLTSPQVITSTSAGVAISSGSTYPIIIRAINAIGASTNSTSITSYYHEQKLFQISDYVLGGSPKATINSGDGVVTLTTATSTQFGSVWSGKRIDVTKDFVIDASVRLSNGVYDGADGMAFVVQPASTAAGSSGGGLGYQGISNSFAVEFDTYFNSGADSTSSDHIAYIANGAAGSSAAHTAYVTPYTAELEDGTWRDVRFIYNATTKKLTTEFETADGTELSQILTATVDLRILVGNDYAYWGFTAATGGQVNLQQVKITSYSAAFRPNTSPTISSFSNQLTLPSTTSSPIAFTYSDESSTLDQFILTATSSDQTLIKDSDITFSSKTTTGANLNFTSLNKSGTATITVKVQDADGSIATSTFDVVIFGPAAAPTNLQLTPSDGTLSATFTQVPDADLGGGTFVRYEYQVDSGSWVSINSNNSFSLTGLTNNTSYTVKVRAVTTRSGNTQLGAVATATNKPNIAPALTDSPVISGSARYGQAFSATSGSWSNLGITYTYQWQRANSVDENASWSDIASATTSSYVTNTNDLGKYLRIKVTATNSAGSQVSYSLPSTEILDQPATIDTDPSLGGTATVDSVLTVSPGTWNGTRNSVTYQWYRAGIAGGTDVAIPGATGTSYTLTPEDVGRRIYVVETARNSYSRNGVDALTNFSATVAKNSQTVSNFVITGNKSFAESTRTVTADNNRNLLVTFESTTPTVCSTETAVRSGVTSTSQVLYLSAGTCTLVAKQPGTTGYLAANEITQSFEIETSIPTTVRNLSTSVSGSKIRASWTVPQNTGGSAISNYLVTATSGGNSFTCNTSSTTCEIEGLAAGTIYDVTVVATNTAVGISSSKSSATSTAVRAAIPAATSSTTSGNLPTQVTPRPITSLLGNVSSSNQTALINSGVIAPPPSVPVINVAADLSAGSITTPTTVVVSQTVESGAQIDLAIKPPTDTPVGTPVFGTLILSDGKTFDLGQIGITSTHLTNGFSLAPFTILPVGTHFVELRFGDATVAQSVFTSSIFSSSTLSQVAPIYQALSASSQINVKFEINIVAGPNGVPRIQNPTPTRSATPTPTPTPSESASLTPEATPTPEPSINAAGEPEVVIDPRGLEVINPVADAPLAVAETTLTAVALVAAVTAAASAATAVAAAAGAAAGAAGAAGAAAGGSASGGAARAGTSGASSGGSSSSGSSSSAGGSGSGGDPNSEGEDEGSIEGVEFAHEGFEVDSIAWGDELKIWAIPAATALDEPSHRVTEKLAPITPLTSKLIADGAYLKAMLGSLYLIFPILGALLGTIAIVQSTGQLLPPSAVIVTAVAAIGIFDAFAGFIAMAIYVTSIGLTAGVSSLSDIRMLLGILIIGFGPALLAGAFRSIRKPAENGQHYWWERLTDLAIVPFLGGWATKGMVEALPSLAGVKLPIAEQATTIAWTVAIALVLRVILEEFASRYFPNRLNFIHPTDVEGPSIRQQIIALTLRAGIFMFVAGAFIGNSWHLYAGTFLFIAPSYLGLFQDRLPNYPKLYQVLPAGLPGLAFTLLVASASLSGLTAVFGETPDLAKIAFVLLPIPSVILSILGMFGREPAEGDVRWYQRAQLTWLYRIGGIVMLVYTMRLTGII